MTPPHASIVSTKILASISGISKPYEVLSSCKLQYVMVTAAQRDASSRRGLQLSEADRFQLVVEAIEDYAIYMLDPDGNIQSWSSGAERIKGYRSDEVIGKHYSIFFRSEDREEGLPTCQLERAKLHGKTEEEGWRVRKDGSTFWANIILSAILDDDGTHLGFAKITRDITDRQRLREMERSLRNVNKFLAMLGHELRGPLAPMSYALSLLELRGPIDPTQLVPLNTLHRQLGNLTRLLDDLLDAGRLSTGKLRISPRRIDFNSVLEQAVEVAGASIRERSQVLEVAVPPRKISVNADDLRIAQVLQNLLSNASKFTPKGGHIAVTVYLEAQRLVVVVTDNGMGMDPSTIDDLFRLFVQGESTKDLHLSGLGIGLALSRAIVEMHGGKIVGTSPGLGKGSIFRFDIPGAEYAEEPESA